MKTHIICAGNNEIFPFATPVGVGLVESAMNLTRLLLFDRPDNILFIATAGSYGKYNIFDIVESTSASNIELSFFENNSYTPLDNVVKNEFQAIKNETIVNSSNYITTNKKLGKYYQEYDIEIENMEFFSLLKIASDFKIPIGGIFIITNFTDNNAHKDYLKNYKEAIKRLTKYLIEKQIINVSRETL